jgi:hypothetical protein
MKDDPDRVKWPRESHILARGSWYLAQKISSLDVSELTQQLVNAAHALVQVCMREKLPEWEPVTRIPLLTAAAEKMGLCLVRYEQGLSVLYIP